MQDEFFTDEESRRLPPIPRPCFDGLPMDRFNGVWRACSRVIVANERDVMAFLLRHYLHSAPAIPTMCLLVTVRDVAVGTVVFSLPPIETAKRYGGVVWELARLYLLDEIPRNAESWALAQSVNIVKRTTNVDALVSYADTLQGHTGLIYRAANWIDDGHTDDERKTPRIDYFDAITAKRYARRNHIPSGAVVERVRRGRKNRYVMRLPHDRTRPPKPSAPDAPLSLGI